MTINSKRQYNVAICDSLGLTVEPVSIVMLFGVYKKNDELYEWVFALQDITDSVLDLKVGESMHFQPNRDDNTSKGIILRIS